LPSHPGTEIIRVRFPFPCLQTRFPPIPDSVIPIFMRLVDAQMRIFLFSLRSPFPLFCRLQDEGSIFISPPRVYRWVYLLNLGALCRLRKKSFVPEGPLLHSPHWKRSRGLLIRDFFNLFSLPMLRRKKSFPPFPSCCQKGPSVPPFFLLSPPLRYARSPLLRQQKTFPPRPSRFDSYLTTGPFQLIGQFSRNR